MDLIFASGNIFTCLDLPNADELQYKADLAVAINRLIEETNLSHVEAAHRMEVSPPQLLLIMNGKLRGFSIGDMLRMEKRLECAVHISLQKSTQTVDKIR